MFSLNVPIVVVSKPAKKSLYFALPALPVVEEIAVKAVQGDPAALVEDINIESSVVLSTTYADF